MESKQVSTDYSKALGYHEYDPGAGPEVHYAPGAGVYPPAKSEPPILHMDFHGSHPGATSGAAKGGLELHEADTAASNKRRRRSCILISAVIFIALAIGLGVGLGVGLTQKERKSGTNGSSSPADAPSSNNPGNTPPPVVRNDAAAYNGTSLSAMTYSPTGQPTEQNYVVFYQHSNGDVRKIIYNESHWHPSELVTKEARPGTGFASVFLGPAPSIYLYYVDKNNFLQELRGSHGSNMWVNGTLGLAHFKVSAAYPHIDGNYAGGCSTGGRGSVYFQPDDGPVQEAVWNQDSDSWNSGLTFTNTKRGSDFLTVLEPGVWRFYAITDQLQLQEYVCNNCCANSSVSWEQGLTHSALANNSGLGGGGVGADRLLYYKASNDYLQELNNTGPPNAESWDSDPRVVVQNMLPSSKIAFAAGFVGKDQIPSVFYQTNGSDVTVSQRIAANKYWMSPIALPVGL